jgi:predicted nucleotidyltransferase
LRVGQEGNALNRGGKLDLKPEHAEAIRLWGMQTPQVRDVRLFGSRAKGCAKANSDVDLAVTADAGHYVALASKWEEHLSKMLNLTVHIRDFAHNEAIQKACEDCSLLLFRR